MAEQNPVEKTTSNRCLDLIIAVVACAMVLYHMAATQFILLNDFIHQDIHLAFALALTFLIGVRNARFGWFKLITTGLLLVGVAVTAYIIVFFEPMSFMQGLPDHPTFLVGIALIAIVVVGCWYAWGAVLPIMGSIAVLYFLFGQNLPEPFFHLPFDVPFVISTLGVGFSGIFGSLLGTSANEIFLLVVFGGLLQATGAHKFFLEIGRVAGRFLAGGPGQTSIIGSALVGMVSGSAMANVAITGSFTIPLMKRVGYHPAKAGGIEAVASSGGQVMPPVMGAAAFLMAVYLNVPYVEVMLAGAIPALLYFLAAAFGVQLIAKKDRILPSPDKPNVKMLILQAPLFVIPLAVLTALLFMRFSPAFAAFWTIILMIALAYLRRETRPSLSNLIQGFVNGAIVGAKLGVAIACVALISQTLITTGLGIIISTVVEDLARGNLVVALILTMFLSLLLGIGMPTMAVYTIVAVAVIPVLVRMGVTPIAAHFFALYMGVKSAITPPVAMASLAAAGIAGSGYWRTSLEAFRLGISGLIIPFLIVFNPVLVLKPLDPLWSALSLIAIPLGLLALTTLLYGYFITKLNLLEWCWMLVATVGLFGYAMTKDYTLFGLGVIAFISITFWQLRHRHSEQPIKNAEPAARTGFSQP